jgi:uncharacterized protein (DUF433 family)
MDWKKLLRLSPRVLTQNPGCVMLIWPRRTISSANRSTVACSSGTVIAAGTRVSLDSIVYAFLEGHTAESIQQSFPLLTLEQVYGAITYYLANREAIDTYLQEQEAAFETLKERLRRANPHMAQRIAELKHQHRTARP